MTVRPKHILISGGGTGGHIFPALAIADGLKKRLPNAEILFVGAKGRMEMQKVPEAGYPIKGLWISGFNRSWSFSNLMFPFKLLSSIWSSAAIISKFAPDLVIGVGGYASGPLLWTAMRLGVPALIQEQNAFPGITNRLLAQRVQRICVAFNGMDRWFPSEKTVITGNPLRPHVIDIEGKKTEALTFFGLEANKPVALITGGSQGARSINAAILSGLDFIVQSNVQLIWQCGQAFLTTAQAALQQRHNSGVCVLPFIARMDLAYAAADLVVARAGAMTIAELAATAKPAILIPLPTAAENHQMHNALQLKNENAAMVLEDHQAVEQLATSIVHLANNALQRKALGNNIKKFARINATELIVDEALKLMTP